MSLTQDRARELLDYDLETGVFSWRVQRGKRKAGSVAGCPHGTGYVVIGIDGRLHLAHRLAWLWMTGHWPIDQIDHANGVKDDNRFANLREATTSENHQNMPLRRDNRAGQTGVHWDATKSKWVAQIACGGKRRTLGVFDTVDEAKAAYVAAKPGMHRFQPVPREALG